MSRSRQFAKGGRDRNEEEIKAVLRAAGIKYLILPPGHGADLLLLVNPVAFLEVKNGASAKLTETEKAMKWHCEEHGIEYRIVRSADDTAAMLNGRRAAADAEKG